MEDEIIYEDVKYQKFNESLDTNGEIDIAGYQFYPSFILFKTDRDLFVEAYFEFKERCIFCDIIKQELKDGSRIVAEIDGFIILSPFAARFPFEL